MKISRPPKPPLCLGSEVRPALFPVSYSSVNPFKGKTTIRRNKNQKKDGWVMCVGHLTGNSPMEKKRNPKNDNLDGIVLNSSTLHLSCLRLCCHPSHFRVSNQCQIIFYFSRYIFDRRNATFLVVILLKSLGDPS